VNWCRDAVGRFPDYPSEEEGGSLMIFKEKDPAEVEAALKALVGTARMRFNYTYKIFSKCLLLISNLLRCGKSPYHMKIVNLILCDC